MKQQLRLATMTSCAQLVLHINGSPTSESSIGCLPGPERIAHTEDMDSIHHKALLLNNPCRSAQEPTMDGRATKYATVDMDFWNDVVQVLGDVKASFFRQHWCSKPGIAGSDTSPQAGSRWLVERVVARESS